MVAFSKDKIPASIDTLEKLEAWASTVLAYLNSSTTAIEGTNPTNAVTTRVSHSSPYFVTADAADPHWRLVSRNSIRLDAKWTTGQQKIWNYVQSTNTNSIPVEFTT
ncbi:hypothetical protein [Scytonema sp. PCC 10023]|uniref:hypothetical protein n=1 Tax=Scytonema sp. PCC 10023 TaxID=1680591 RepID=UPI0039C75AD5